MVSVAEEEEKKWSAEAKRTGDSETASTAHLKHPRGFFSHLAFLPCCCFFFMHLREKRVILD